MTKILAASIICALAVSISGCSSVAKSLGATREAPNEFNIVTKAPLVVPPEYKLRPPASGEARAEDNYSSEAARKALLGDIDSAEPSRGELALMAKAKVATANPEIRLLVDAQNSVEQKTDGFTDRVIFWRDGKAIDNAGNPLNPDEEARRIEAVNSVTGGGAVTIAKRPTSNKLPGM